MKFRAWHRRKKDFIHPVALVYNGENNWYAIDSWGDIFLDDEVTVQQSTHLFDSEGKEIYVGDILECFASNNVFLEPGESIIGEVIFNKEFAMFEVAYQDGKSDLIGSADPKIIGHINDGRNWSFV